MFSLGKSRVAESRWHWGGWGGSGEVGRIDGFSAIKRRASPKAAFLTEGEGAMNYFLKDPLPLLMIIVPCKGHFL